MNWLAYFALLFSTVFAFLHRPWSLYLATASAACGLLSVLIRHWSFIEKITSTFLAKVMIAVVAAGALVISPWIANALLSEITLLRPGAFPTAYTALQAMITLLLWASLFYCALILATGFNFLRSFRGAPAGTTGKHAGKKEFFAWLGRFVGLLVLLFYLAPLLLRSANYDSRGLISNLVLATSFTDNVGQSVTYSSVSPDLPADCRRLASDTKVNLKRVYTCAARTIRCSNIDEMAKIAYLSDTDIVVATTVDRNTPLYELNPIRFDVAKCENTKRYEYKVQQSPEAADTQ